MTDDLLSRRRRPDGRPLPDDTVRRRRARRQRWTGAVVLVGTALVAGAGVWWSLEAREPHAELLVRVATDADASVPLDGRQIVGPADVFVGTDGEIDLVAYRLTDDEGETVFSGAAWTSPFTVLAAAGQDADPLSAGILPPGNYVLTASVGFTDGRRSEIAATFEVGVAAPAEPEGVDEGESTAPNRGGDTEESPKQDADDSLGAERGRPGPDNTGPRISEQELEPSDGLVVTEDGAIVDGLDIAGTLLIEANDVVVRDTRVSSSAPYPLRVMPGASGTLIEYVEVDGEYSLDNNGCIQGSNVTVRHSELHRCTDGAKVGSGSVYEFNWIHDPTRDDSGSGTDGHGNHVDGLQSTGGHGIIIRGNHIDVIAADGNPSNAAIIMKSNFGAITDCLIEGNWLNGGNYTIFLREGTHGPPTGCAVHGNRFGRDFRHGLLSTDGDVALSGNVWDDDGRPVQD